MCDYSKRLKELRANHNLTQKQLAENCSLSFRTIQNYELGERKPTYDVIIALVSYFNVSADYLLGLSDDPTRH